MFGSQCPRCGYCPHCGRGGQNAIPYGPQVPPFGLGDKQESARQREMQQRLREFIAYDPKQPKSNA